MFVNDDINSLIREELIGGENILWSGQPEHKIFCKNDIKMIPFSILWGGFAMFWEISVLVMGAPIVMPIFGALFVLIGLYAMFGRFFYKAHVQKRTYYYVTNKRVIVAKVLGRTKIEAEYINSLTCINKDIKNDGSGDVIFGNIGFLISMYANTGMESLAKGKAYGQIPLAFYDLARADEVSKIINEVRNGRYDTINRNNKTLI